MATAATKSMYPLLKVEHIQNPNKFWAIPVLGGLAKIVILIPQYIMMIFLGIALFFVIIINSFIVFFTGKYWDTCYDLNLKVMRFTTKIALFFMGLTDKYPGFDFNMPPGTELTFAKPEAPNRLFAFPLFGGLVRGLLLIPFIIYVAVIQYAAGLGVVIASFPVLFTGKYPEAFYELARDYLRLNNAITVYFIGASDSYPSFWMSMNHKTTKIVLIVIATLYLLFSNVIQALVGGEGQQEMLEQQFQQQYQEQYQQQYEQMMQDAQDGTFNPSDYQIPQE